MRALTTLKKGQRVKGVVDAETIYTGTVRAVDGASATVVRDDKVEGGGIRYHGRNGWLVQKKRNGRFGADTTEGQLYPSRSC